MATSHAPLLSRRLLALAGVVLLLGAGDLLGLATTLRRPHRSTPALVAAGPHLGLATVSPPPTAPPATAPPTTVAPTDVPVSTVLAAPRGTITTYRAPGDTPIGTLGTWYGYALVVPVVSQQPGWLQVRLPQRPNGSTAWVHSSDVVLSSTPYAIVVELGIRNLFVYQAGHKILAFPVGIGTPATPTVTGHFFVAVREVSPASPDYGPFILDTSAHSDAILSWEGAGDAIIAIHGPITPYADSEIGATGARISNGCIRLHDSDLAQLAPIPLGTPVEIVA